MRPDSPGADTRTVRNTRDMRERGQDFENALARLLAQTGAEPNEAAASVVWHLLRVTRLVETTLDYEVHRPQGWSWSGFRVMANLYVEGALEPGELATILNVSRPSITNLIDRLEKADLLRRSQHPANRAKVVVELTDAGRTAVESAAAQHHEGEVAAVSGLSGDEQRLLASLLHRMYEHLSRKT